MAYLILWNLGLKTSTWAALGRDQYQVRSPIQLDTNLTLPSSMQFLDTIEL